MAEIKTKKPVVGLAEPAFDAEAVINELRNRIDKLEDQQLDSTKKIKVIVKWSRFAEEATKSIYGMGVVGAAFGELARKLES